MAKTSSNRKTESKPAAAAPPVVAVSQPAVPVDPEEARLHALALADPMLLEARRLQKLGDEPPLTYELAWEAQEAQEKQGLVPRHNPPGELYSYLEEHWNELLLEGEEERAKAGRPSLLTPALLEDIATAADAGLKDALIYQRLGIKQRTWSGWLNHPEGELLRTLEQARAGMAQRLLRDIALMPKGWQAGAWILNQLFPEQYARPGADTTLNVNATASASASSTSTSTSTTQVVTKQDLEARQARTKRNRERFVCVQAGLLDCPHIPRSKIDDLTATYEHTNPQYLRSVLHGEFMDAEEEQVFDREGLAHLKRLVLGGERRPTDGRLDPIPGGVGSGARSKQVQFVPCRADDPSRWFRMFEQPIEGCRYLVVCDSAKGRKEHVTARKPDRQAVLVLRDAYTDRFTCNHKPAVVARIIPPCEYRIERVAPLVGYLSTFYGHCTVVVEENNTGLALIQLLKRDNVPLYRRREGTPQSPKFEDGFYTEKHIRQLMVAEGAEAIYEKTWDIWCPHLLAELRTFVRKPDGREEAEGNLKDDDVLAWLIGRRCLPSGTVYRNAVTQQHRHIERYGSTS